MYVEGLKERVDDAIIARLIEEKDELRKIIEDLLRRLDNARPESIGSIGSHRSARYSREEIEIIRKILKEGYVFYA